MSESNAADGLDGLGGVICACGCGGLIEWKPRHRYRKPRFLPGHANRGKQRRRYIPTPEEIPSGLCECGCGKSTGLAKHTIRSRRHFKGYPLPLLQHHFPHGYGPDWHRWKGGRYLHDGYVMVYSPEHPNADHDGYVPEHRLVMEQQLGRTLQRNELVHHISHIKTDNRPENLMLVSHAEHMGHHRHRTYSEDSKARMRAGGMRGAASRWHQN